MNPCRICGRDPGSPWRVYDTRGKVVQGCVGADHDGHLQTCSESSLWHYRADAKRIRSAIAKRQTAT